MATTYATGTLSLTNGSVDVVLTGGLASPLNIREGDVIVIAGSEINAVAVITDLTHFSLARPYSGATGANKPFVVVNMPTGWGDRVALAEAVVELIRDLEKVQAYFDVQVAVLADRAAFDARPAGFRVMVSNTGDGRAAIYSKVTNVSGNWSAPAYVTGPNSTVPGPPGQPGVAWTGPYDNTATYAVNDGVTFNGSSFRKLTTAAAGTSPSGASPPVTTANWEVMAAKGSGDVSGPAASVDGRQAVFDGPTGKLIKDGTDRIAMSARPNLSVNGSLIDAIENPANPVLTANASFYADQHALFRSTDLATNISVQRVAYTSLAGGSAAAEFKVPVAKPALAATSIATDTEVIEGSRPDFVAAGWGAAGAKSFVHRKEVQKPAGTYSIHVTNRFADWHCWVPYIVMPAEANIKVVKEIVIPAAVAGTWFKGDGLIGMVIDDVLCAGSNFVGGAAGVWGGFAFYAGAGQKNLLDNTANVARHADFGTRLDPSATGFYGTYRVGEKDRDYCSERYVFRINVLAIKGVVANGIGAAVCTCPVSTRLAKAPTIMSNVGNLLFGDGFSNVEFSSVVAGSMTREVISFQPAGIVSGSFGTAGRPVVGLASGDIIAIARPS